MWTLDVISVHSLLERYKRVNVRKPELAITTSIIGLSGSPVGFLLLWYSVLFTVESLFLLYLLFI